MTVKQLIDKLLALNPAGDCEIVVNGNYYWDWAPIDEDEINILDESSICIGKEKYEPWL